MILLPRNQIFHHLIETNKNVFRIKKQMLFHNTRQNHLDLEDPQTHQDLHHLSVRHVPNIQVQQSSMTIIAQKTNPKMVFLLLNHQMQFFQLNQVMLFFKLKTSNQLKTRMLKEGRDHQGKKIKQLIQLSLTKKNKDIHLNIMIMKLIMMKFQQETEN